MVCAITSHGTTGILQLPYCCQPARELQPAASPTVYYAKRVRCDCLAAYCKADTIRPRRRLDYKQHFLAAGIPLEQRGDFVKVSDVPGVMSR